MAEIMSINLKLGKTPVINLKLAPKISFRTKTRIERIVTEENAIIKKISDTEINISQDKAVLFEIIYKLNLLRNSSENVMHNVICQEKKIVLQRARQSMYHSLEEMKDTIFLAVSHNAIYEEVSPQVAFIYCPNKVTQMNLFAELGMYYIPALM